MKFRRRRYLINTNYQMRIITIFVFIAFIGSLAAIGLFNFLANNKLETLIWSTHISAHSTGELIKPLFITINIAGFIFVSILILITAFIITRRTSVPLQSMAKDIAKAADGDLTVVIPLPQSDEFRDTASELNNMLKSIRARFKVINDSYMDISNKLEDLNAKRASADYLDTILLQVESLETELNKFKV